MNAFKNIAYELGLGRQREPIKPWSDSELFEPGSSHLVRTTSLLKRFNCGYSLKTQITEFKRLLVTLFPSLRFTSLLHNLSDRPSSLTIPNGGKQGKESRFPRA